MASILTSRFCDLWDQHAPLIKRRQRLCCTPWITSEVLLSIHKRNAAYKHFLKDRPPKNYLTYKQATYFTKMNIRLAKRKFFMNGVSKGSRVLAKH